MDDFGKGTKVYIPCGAWAIADGNGGFVCQNCFCVVGSVGMPIECYELLKKKRIKK